MAKDHESRPAADDDRDDERGEHNEIGYRNADEEQQYDERGSQGSQGAHEKSNEGSRD